MKYLLLLLPITFSCAAQETPNPEQEVASFLMRNGSELNSTKKVTPAPEKDRFKNSSVKKTYIGISGDMLAPFTALLVNPIEPHNYINGLGLTVNNRYRNSKTNKTAYEYQFKFFPIATYNLIKKGFPIPIAAFTYQRLRYFSPARASSGYIGAGIGVSTYQGIPIHVSLGREFNSFSEHTSFLELRISTPITFFPLANANVTFGFEF
ncbi:hypothetical protein K0U07_01930 [bacterium]|nr:hypothetical protein [bacterium]